MRTKSAPAIALAIALWSASSAAQSTFGVVGGLTSANVKVSDLEVGDPTPKSIIGFAIGLSMHRPINDAVSFNPEAMFIQKGFKLEEDDFDFESTLKITVSLLEVPLLFRYNFGDVTDEQKPHFFLTAGPSVALKLTCKFDVDFESDEFGSGSESGDCDDDDAGIKIKSTDIGLIGGVGVTKGKLSASLRYGMGISNVSDADDIGNATVKTRTIAVVAGFKF